MGARTSVACAATAMCGCVYDITLCNKLNKIIPHTHDINKYKTKTDRALSLQRIEQMTAAIKQCNI